uniref:Uncharacterized protein n=1 Tax=Chlamydomonas euryale TaxID=1486919 RepID=A0A6U2JNN8_9CHLO|mmetsp:Transcript_8038/g.24234  ORF Transcript_8038/g.24234 Transcript_8038/m.24234 type:complete len:126 (+) Transcript_8038:282-659(+)
MRAPLVTRCCAGDGPGALSKLPLLKWSRQLRPASCERQQAQQLRGPHPHRRAARGAPPSRPAHAVLCSAVTPSGGGGGGGGGGRVTPAADGDRNGGSKEGPLLPDGGGGGGRTVPPLDEIDGYVC